MLSVINLMLLIPAGNSKQYSSVNLSKHQILIVLSLLADMNKVFYLGWIIKLVTVFECPPKECIIFLCLCSFHTNMCPK